MFKTNRRGNLVWLLFMVLAGLLFLGSGELGALAVLGVFAIFFVMMLFMSQAQRITPVPQQQVIRVPATPSARTAHVQASQRPDFDDYYGLQDVGLIVDEPRSDGLKLKRVRAVSLDEEAIRPYIVVVAPAMGHPNQVLVRFELTDAGGQSQFIYEMDYYMRPGENIVLPDYRLPLRGNPRLNRTGKWDLHVWINGGLLAVHTFSVSPSLEERRRQFGIDGEAQERLELEHDPMPVSLDELLKQQSGRSSRN